MLASLCSVLAKIHYKLNKVMHCAQLILSFWWMYYFEGRNLRALLKSLFYLCHQFSIPVHIHMQFEVQ